MVMIKNRNDFILRASQLAMHALIVSNKTPVQPDDLAALARQHAVALWRVMRAEITNKD